MRKYLLALAMAGLALGFLAACESGVSSGGGLIYRFVNDTSRRVTVARNGGEAWEDEEPFVLQYRGSEKTVVLKKNGDIKFRYQAYPDNSGIEYRAVSNEIVFTEN